MLLNIIIDGKVNEKWMFAFIRGEAISTDFSYNLPLWFLPMLFCCLSAFYVQLVIIKKKKYIGIVSIILSILGYLMMLNKKFLFWNIDIALFLQIVLYAGYFCFDYANIFKIIHISSIKSMVSVPFLVILYVGACMRNTRVDLNGRNINSIYLF